ncbi:MAG: hypothetical protein IKC47_04985, partial [Clostridia bacterium]|nr:hypothetical protein [Clostridia bacterium]
MSKQQNTKAVATNNLQSKKVWTIVVICLITAAIIAGSLIIALWDTPDKTVAGTNNETQASSSATIKNGDFQYLKEAATSFPKSASNWTKYTYKAPTGSTQGFTEISTNNETVMGVVSVKDEDWTAVQADVAALGVAGLANPGKAQADDKDDNVYMISNKTAYTASIYSQSFSIASATSVKISFWVKTVDVAGNGGVFAIVKSSSNALEQSTGGVQQWYANVGVSSQTNYITGTNDWQQVELYVFNQTSSSKTVYFNIGLGDIYNNNTATGTAFVDNIEYEKVTSNDYRLHHDDGTTAYTIERDNVANATYDLNWTNGTTTLTNDDYLALTNNVAPFNLAAGKVYTKIANDGTNSNAVELKTSNLLVRAGSLGIQYHISFWVRVISENNSVLPHANIYLNYADGTETTAKFTTVQTATDIVKDTNNGWAQYHFYVSPADVAEKSVSVSVFFGDKNGYPANSTMIPNGSVLVTTPVVEELYLSEYNAVSSGTYVAKLSLNEATATSTVTNGSFGNAVTNSNHLDALHTPTNWTPVFAGSSSIYLTGNESQVTVDNKVNSVTSGIQFNSHYAPNPDDSQKAVLQITNNTATSFGYLSSAVTAPANAVTVFSVLVNADSDATPYVYLLKQAEDGTYAKYVEIACKSQAAVDDGNFLMQQVGNGWIRYYLVVATGDTSATMKIALFNGAIDATADNGTTTGTVYFDQVLQSTIGSYVRDNTAEEMFTKDEDGNWKLDEALAGEMTYTATA